VRSHKVAEAVTDAAKLGLPHHKHSLLPDIEKTLWERPWARQASHDVAVQVAVAHRVRSY